MTPSHCYHNFFKILLYSLSVPFFLAEHQDLHSNTPTFSTLQGQPHFFCVCSKRYIKDLIAAVQKSLRAALIHRVESLACKRALLHFKTHAWQCPETRTASIKARLLINPAKVDCTLAKIWEADRSASRFDTALQPKMRHQNSQDYDRRNTIDTYPMDLKAEAATQITDSSPPGQSLPHQIPPATALLSTRRTPDN